MAKTQNALGHDHVREQVLSSVGAEEDPQEERQPDEVLLAARLIGCCRPRPRPTDEPDWEAPALHGWWTVVHNPCCWAREAPSTDARLVEVIRHGEVLAMQAASPDGLWLRLRDGGGEGELWMLRDAEALGLGQLLEELPTGRAPPLREARARHLRVVEERLAAHARLGVGQRDDQAALRISCDAACQAMAQDDDTLQRLQVAQHKVLSDSGIDKAFAVGVATDPFRWEAATAALLRGQRPGRAAALDPNAYREFEKRFLKDGYVVLDGALPGGGQDFIEEMARLDQIGALRPAPQQALGQRGDRILWLDEALAKGRYCVPAVASAVALLKGVAHALQPAISRHAAERSSAGDPAYAELPAPPATSSAVLSVPPNAMVASYPGGGAGYKAHVDNQYIARLGRRVNPRELTAILYANPPDWRPRDGGDLLLWPHSTHDRWGDCVQIQPFGCRLVVFFSAFRHQVLPAWRERRAITLWIFRPDKAGC
mmetsp:Transcript_34406/g.106845  ORF Transcript_34406/g.106845 Transcript_34406/m.106845 type:complete len:485 (+) Transcript_34406:22-1476(+)